MTIEITEGYAPGCIGRIAQLHAQYYAAAHGFGLAFEAKVATELSGFCERYVPGRDGLWLVRHGQSIEGSIAIDGSRGPEGPAHLRWFITSDPVRGQGAGRQLLQRALDLVDANGHVSTSLWTFTGLGAARHLYEVHGFRMVHENPGLQWGALVNEQRFERLRP